jgi:hypothetical protein
MNELELRNELEETGRAWLPASEVPLCTLLKETIAPTRTSGVVVKLVDGDFVLIKDRGHKLSAQIHHKDGSHELVSSNIGLVFKGIKRSTEPWSVSRIS